MLLIELCKLVNEILKEGKNPEKSLKNHIRDRKMSFLSVFSLFQNFIFIKNFE